MIKKIKDGISWRMKLNRYVNKQSPLKFRMTNLFIKSLSHLGLKITELHYCPFCHSDIYHWIHVKTSDNIKCPCCGSYDRDRFSYFYLDQKQDINSVQRLLHFAPEPSLGSFFKSNINEYITTDPVMPNVTHREDIRKLSFDNESIDAIYCSHVLEHIDNDRQAIHELYRVLKPMGWAFIHVPIREGITYEDASITTPEEREQAFGQFDHVRWYGMDITERLQEAGFHVETIYADQALRPLKIDCNQFGIQKDLPGFFCQKPKT